MSIFRRFNLVGRVRDAEAEAAVLKFQNLLLNATLQYGVEQYIAAENTLREISGAAAAVGSPNGTTRKLGRMADEALEALALGIAGSPSEFGI